jgi:hypothetical protein
MDGVMAVVPMTSGRASRMRARRLSSKVIRHRVDERDVVYPACFSAPAR